MIQPAELGFASKVQEVLATKPTITRAQISKLKLESTFTLPYGNFIVGSVMYPSRSSENRDIELHIDDFEVNSEMRKQGIGTKLLKALTADGKRHGAVRLYGFVLNERALRTRIKVFGKDNVEFFNYSKRPSEMIEEEVIAKNYFPLYVYSDLKRINTEGWD